MQIRLIEVTIKMGILYDHHHDHEIGNEMLNQMEMSVMEKRNASLFLLPSIQISTKKLEL